jgi:hypothetical protein
MEFIQKEISKATKKTKDPNHGKTNVRVWSKKLVNEIMKAMPKEGTYDENMRFAATMGFVLVLWYARLHKAKIYDPRRPIKTRQTAYHQWMLFCHSIFNAMMDESLDAEFFKQHFDPPFSPHAVDGVFI